MKEDSLSVTLYVASHAELSADLQASARYHERVGSFHTNTAPESICPRTRSLYSSSHITKNQSMVRYWESLMEGTSKSLILLKSKSHRDSLTNRSIPSK